MNRESPTLSLILVLAMFSGAAALSLELLWARQLALTFGSSHYAVTTTLAGFLMGMGGGSFVGGRIADRSANPLKWLAGAELALVILGPVLTTTLIQLPTLAAVLLPSVSITHPVAVLSRFLLALLIMAPATFLMGATFPLMARSIAGGSDALHRALPWLYGLNTFGGVLGVVASSFWLLPNFGVVAVAGAAAAANAGAGTLGLTLARRSPIQPQSGAATANPVLLQGTLFLVLAGLSGAAVLAGETVWNRVLSVVLPNSTYTFALILALYLGGLALGGIGASALIRIRNPLKVWALIQTSATVWILFSLVLLPKVPTWVRLIRPPDGWGRVLITPLAVGGSLILPAVILLGAAWPLLLAAGTPTVNDSGRRIGLMGMTNSIGAAVGGMLTGWWLIPWLGIGRTLIVLAALHTLLAAAAIARTQQPRAFKALTALTIVLLAVGLFLAPFGAMALPSTAGESSIWETLLYKESATGTVTVLEDPSSGRRSMFVDNSAVIGTTYDALKVVRMLGLLPTLFHAQPDNALVIGYGAGVTTSVLAASPAVRSIDVQEIIPSVVEASHLFEAVNHEVLLSPKVRLGYGDGRNFLLMSENQWDVITCDPVHPLYGSAPLYSLEFFQLCKLRLKDGGQMYQYLPLHHMPPRAFRQAIGTFSAVFPHSRVAFSLGHGVLIGSDQPIEMDWNLWSKRLRSFEEQSDLVDAVLQTPAQIAALLQLDTEGCQSVGLQPYSSDLVPILEFLEPEAFEAGVWQANAQTLIEAYDSPIDSILGLPPYLAPDIRRLIAGKRLLLFSQLERNEGRMSQASDWLSKALTVVPEDPEIIRFAEQGRREGWYRR